MTSNAASDWVRPIPSSLGGVVRADLIQADEGDRPITVMQGRLLQFVFIDRDKKKDVAEFHLENRDQSLWDAPELRKGQKWQITWGWQTELAIPRRMVVQSLRQGNPLVVTLHDESTLMDKRPKHRTWHNATDSDVVAEIAAEYGYEGVLADIEPTIAVRRNITQSSSDARFVQRLARRNGCIWYVDATGLHFHQRRYGVAPSHAFSYPGGPGGERVMGDPRIEGRLSNIALIKVKARDPWTKQAVESEIGVATDDAAGTLGDYIQQVISLGAEEELGDPDAPEGARQARVSRTLEVNLGAATQDEVNAAAIQWYTETIRNKYRMEVTVLGDPTVGAKQVHYWRMATEAFSGLYYCKEAKTTIVPGRYDMELKYVKDALGKIALANVLPVPKPKNSADEPPSKEDLTKVASIGGWENGEYVPKWIYVDDKGKTLLDAEKMTNDEIEQLSEAKKAYLQQASGGGLQLPGD